MAYEGGVWKVKVSLPDHYTFRPPSVDIMNKIFHSNIDQKTSMVFLDVVKQTCTSLHDPFDVFELLVPQLFTSRNPQEPPNCDAANRHLNKVDTFQKVVHHCVQKYA
ncbi:hypothetical protein HPB48_011709 [Haemaphysalis longicornis]|uniref:UBC core domain-containing protein n=1 Tax=Haemaphysalis longicornis TaxID=44386 RepID=A0A9J6H2A1_HAELO|nr:hypothetical protein HPB48_011709 [Haemaphysalis longicornis]